MASICGSPVCAGGKPQLKFTYTGDYVVRDDGVVELHSSGTLVFLKDAVIDLFLVGGGGGGGYATGNQSACGGGGGGYTLTVKSREFSAGFSAEVTVGAGSAPNGAGGKTRFANYEVDGGESPSGNFRFGGNGGSGGGSGGIGGADGSNGYGDNVGSGQGTTTREFGEPGGKLYAGGGGGGQYVSNTAPVPYMGGDGGGGKGGVYSVRFGKTSTATKGVSNTGGGGGGGARYDSVSDCPSGFGGSGIVCFRLAA